MSKPVRTHSAIRTRWSEDQRAEHYGDGRFRNERAAGRDPRCVAGLLHKYGVRGDVLDVPCGTGRLRASLTAGSGGSVHAGRSLGYVGLDASLAMLREAPDQSGLLVGDAAQLPFEDGAFDVVVSCRLLHHLGQPEDRMAVLRELARVSSRLVIASFWDAASLHALRRRVGLKHDTSTRRALARRTLVRELEQSGLRVLTWRHTFRFISQQAFFVAEKV